MPATQEQLDDLANDVVLTLNGAAFQVGQLEALRLTTGVYEVRIQEHGEHFSEPIVIGDE